MKEKRLNKDTFPRRSLTPVRLASAQIHRAPLRSLLRAAASMETYRHPPNAFKHDVMVVAVCYAHVRLV